MKRREKTAELNNLGERLFKFRESKGFSLADMGEVLGLHRANLHKVEKGEAGINEVVLYNLLRKYPNFNIKWLLFGEGEMEEVKIKNQTA